MRTPARQAGTLAAAWRPLDWGVAPDGDEFAVPFAVEMPVGPDLARLPLVRGDDDADFPRGAPAVSVAQPVMPGLDPGLLRGQPAGYGFRQGAGHC